MTLANKLFGIGEALQQRPSRADFTELNSQSVQANLLVACFPCWSGKGVDIDLCAAHFQAAPVSPVAVLDYRDAQFGQVYQGSGAAAGCLKGPINPLLNVSNGDCSFSFWMNTTQRTDGNLFCYQQSAAFNGYSIEINSAGADTPQVGAYFSSTATDKIQTVKSLNDGQWHHITLVKGNSVQGTGFTGWAYVDGVLDNTSVVSTATVFGNTTGPFTIGMHSQTINFYTGLVCDIRIYDRALSAGEAYQLYDWNTRWELYQPRQRLIVPFKNIKLATGSAAGDSTASATSAKLVKQTGSAAGTSTAVAVRGASAARTLTQVTRLRVGGVPAYYVKPVASVGSTATAAGDSTASGIGAKLVKDTGTAAGDSTASGIGAKLVKDTGTAAGDSTASGTSAVLVKQTGTAAGDSTASGIGAKLVKDTGTAAGDSTAAATSVKLVKDVASAAGDSTASATSVKLVKDVASAAGDSTATGVSAKIAAQTGTAAADSTATAVSAKLVKQTATAAGDSTATALGVELAKATGTAAGDSTATASGTVKGGSIASSAGDSTATAASLTVLQAVGTASGTSTATATSAVLVKQTGTAAGDSTAAATSAKLVKDVASAAGDSTAVATSATIVIIRSTATANGTSTAIAQGVALRQATASASATSTATANGTGVKFTTGIAIGTSTSTVQSATITTGLAVSAGDSTAIAVGVKLVKVTGTAAGDSTATAIGAVISSGTGSATGGGTTSGVSPCIPVGPIWTRGVSDLGTVLRAFRSELTTVLPSNLVYLGLRPDQQPPPQRSDQYIIVTPQIQRVRNDYTTGGGRALLVFDCDLLITVYSRFDVDEHGAHDFYLTDTNYGLLRLGDRVIKTMQMYDPVDTRDTYILSEPLKVVQVGKPVKAIKPGWGRLPLRLTFSFRYALCSAEQTQAHTSQATATAHGDSSANAIAGADTFLAFAQGDSTARATAASLRKAIALAQGTSTATGTGSTGNIAIATSAGTSTATATAKKLVKVTGTAAGTSTASGTRAMLIKALATALGTSTSAVNSGISNQLTGRATGTSTANGLSASLAKALGIAAGTSTATGQSIDWSVGAAPYRYDWVTHQPTISFSADETTVTIASTQVTLTITRPLVSPWNYKPGLHTYWVSKSGSDSNPGNSIQPFLTINKALAVVVPGDLVWIRAGTYNEHLAEPLGTKLPSGTAALPITISCARANDGGGLATVYLTTPASMLSPTAVYSCVNLGKYNVFNGIVVVGDKGRPNAPVGFAQGADQDGIKCQDEPGSAVTNCVVWNNANSGIPCSTTEFLVQANVIFGNGLQAQDHGIYPNEDHIVTNGNISFSNAGLGIHYYTGDLSFPVDYAVIVRNLCFGNGNGQFLLGGAYGLVVNNTGCYGGGTGFYHYHATSHNNTLRHNIFAFNDRNDIGIPEVNADPGDASNFNEDFTDAWPGVPPAHNAYAASVVQGANDISVDPLFTSGSTADFHSNSASCTIKGCYAADNVLGFAQANSNAVAVS